MAERDVPSAPAFARVIQTFCLLFGLVVGLGMFLGGLSFAPILIEYAHDAWRMQDWEPTEAVVRVAEFQGAIIVSADEPPTA